MSHTIGIGESIVIPQREITEEMHSLRRTRRLTPTNHLKNGAKAKILRAYDRPRGQLSVSIERSDTQVKVTALVKDKNGVDITELGHVVVDVIDEISEPWGHDYEIYVVREPQLGESEPDVPPPHPLAHLTPEELTSVGMKRVEIAIPGGAQVDVTAPAPMEVKSDLG